MEMRHKKEEVLSALEYLFKYSTEEKYLNNLSVIFEYIDDLVTLVEINRKTTEKAIDTTLKLTGIDITNREGRRKIQKLTKK